MICRCHTLTCTLHVYKPSVQPAASNSLFLDIQGVTLLLRQFTLFAHANLYYPTTSLRSDFSIIFVAHWDVREVLNNKVWVNCNEGVHVTCTLLNFLCFWMIGLLWLTSFVHGLVEFAEH